MRKVLAMLLIITLLTAAFTGCSSEDTVEVVNNSDIPSVDTSSAQSSSDESSAGDAITPVTIPYPLELYFSSGAGAWYSSITINSDGSFTGEHYDSDMDIVFYCEFKGKFTNIKQINNYTFSLTLESLTTEYEQGYTYTEDGILYKTSYPYGLMNIDELKPAKEFLLYTPETEVDTLSEAFLSWWPLRVGTDSPDKLSLYGLYNRETEDGFFAHPDI